MRSVFCGLLTAGLLLPISAAQAKGLQIAVFLDSALFDHYMVGGRVLAEGAATEMEAFEAGIMAARPDAKFAVVVCDEATAFGVRGIAELWRSSIPLSEGWGCPVEADQVRRSMDELDWADDSEHRIVLATGGWSFGGYDGQRFTLAEAAHRAEHLSIPIHVLQLVAHERANYDLDFVLGRYTLGSHWDDVTTFLSQPTTPVAGRAIGPRRLAGLTGGSYHLTIGTKKRDPNKFYYLVDKLRLKKRLEIPSAESLHASAYGTMKGGRDVLDDLADGSLRPSQVDPGDLPPALRNIDLEPLLDAVWDFVDARRVVERALPALEQVEKHSQRTFGFEGTELARAVLNPPRFMPSRR